MQNDFDRPYEGSTFVTAAGDLETSFPLYQFVDFEAEFSVVVHAPNICCLHRFKLPLGGSADVQGVPSCMQAAFSKEQVRLVWPGAFARLHATVHHWLASPLVCRHAARVQVTAVVVTSGGGMTNMSVYIGSNSTSVQANTLVAVSGTS